jgi:hypothetical protein
VHKGSTQTNKRSKLRFKNKGAKEPKGALVWRTGLSGVPSDSVQCTRNVQLRTLHLRVSQKSLRYNSPDCPVCHRTVRCDSGATALRCNGRLHNARDSATVCGRSQSRGQRRTGQWTVPVRCGTGLSGATRSQRSNGRLHQNPNGWEMWLVHRKVFGGAPDCPVRPSTIDSSHHQRLFWWLRAINTPHPPPLQPSKHSQQCIQYKSNTLHSKDTIQVLDPLKVPNSTLAH